MKPHDCQSKLIHLIAEKYILVGKLLRPGEQPTNYSDEDDDGPADKSASDSKPTAAEKKAE